MILQEIKREISELNNTVSLLQVTINALNQGLHPGSNAEALVQLKAFHQKTLQLSQEKLNALQVQFDEATSPKPEEPKKDEQH